MSKSIWKKSGPWISKQRTTEYVGALPEGVASAEIIQTRSTWSRPRQVKIGADTMTLRIARPGVADELHGLDLDIYEAKRQAAEILGTAPKPTVPTELTAAQAAAMGLVYLDANGDARGYCYCCGRAGFKVDGERLLSRHGFKRPGWGYTYGECSGTRHTPERTLEVALTVARDVEASLASQLAGDLVEETRKRLVFEVEQAKRDRWARKHAECALDAFSANPDPNSEYVVYTRTLLERNRRENTMWLSMLETVDAARLEAAKEKSQ